MSDDTSKKVLRLLLCSCGLRGCELHNKREALEQIDQRTVKEAEHFSAPVQVWQWEGGDAIIGPRSGRKVKWNDGVVNPIFTSDAHYAVVREGDRVEFFDGVVNFNHALANMGLKREDFAGGIERKRSPSTKKNMECEGSHCISASGEVRLLPTGGDGNAILCHACYNNEIKFRKERNRELGDAGHFALPAWDTLKIYVYT